MLSFIFLAIGLLLLIKGADLLVDGSSSIASKFGISSLVIGLTIVAFGTSAPELIINIIAAIRGNADIAIGNINGSNIANLLLVLGITATISPIIVKRRAIQKEIPFMLLAGLMLVIFLSDKYILDTHLLGLDRVDGLALLGFFSIFLTYMFYTAKDIKSKASHEIPTHNLSISLVFIAFGLLGLFIGGQITVNSALQIANTFNISQGLIAATIIAVGTSLPELVTAMSAARRGQTDMAIGNVIGSNIFNIFLVLGLTATISPTPLISSQSVYLDAIYALFAMIMLIILLKTKLPGSTKHGVSKIDGLILLLMYAVYIIFLIYRG